MTVSLCYSLFINTILLILMKLIMFFLLNPNDFIIILLNKLVHLEQILKFIKP